MAITRWTPLDINPINRNFSDLLDDFFNDAVTKKRDYFMPGIDVAETDKAFEISVALPGMNKKDISVNLENNRLTISGERKFKSTENGHKYHIVESQYGQFERSVTLPKDVDQDSVKAKYENGMLNITIQKSEKSVAKQISIS